jgi:hypothetical protein
MLWLTIGLEEVVTLDQNWPIHLTLSDLVEPGPEEWEVPLSTKAVSEPCVNANTNQSVYHLPISPYTTMIIHTYINIWAVKRLKYLIVINRINVIVNSQLITFNHNSFFYAKYPLISCPINFSHFNALINMEKYIGLPCANVFLLITTLAWSKQDDKKNAYSAIERWTNYRLLPLCFEPKKKINKIKKKFDKRIALIAR